MGENEEVKKMIGTISVKIAAHNPSFPLEPIYTFTDSAQSFRIMNVPRRIGKWNIEKVFVNLSYPDNTTITKECVLNGSVWVGTVEGCAVSGTSQNGFVVTASGIDEDGNAVTNYVLGAGDLYVQQLDGTIAPTNSSRMYFYENVPDNPKKGEATFINGTLNIWDGTEWKPVAQSPDPSYIQDAEGDKINADRTVEIVEQGGQTISDELALKSDLPTKTSDLTNDSGFITSADVPTKTSDLTNDSGFITSAEIEPYHNSLTPTENTGLAKTAYTLALNDYTSFKPVEDGQFYATLRTHRDLTNQFRATMILATYWPYVMSKYNGQTLSPELSLYFCKDSLKYGTTRPRSYYDGYMFRTAGAGFAIPCSEDGTPDGRLVETTAVHPSYVLMENNTTSVHSIGFSTAYDDPYGNIVTIDGQSDMIFAHRTNAYKAYSFSEEIANKSELPTKTSDLTNDSGFITATALTPYREKSDLYYEHSFHKANW